MPKATENKVSYIQRYEAENCRQYRLRFSKKYDAEIIEKLDSVDNKIDYIRGLIRADLEKKS